MQIEQNKNENLELKFYFDKLPKKDQAKFTGYLMWKLCISYNGIWNRINGRSAISVSEDTMIRAIIKSEEWKQ